MLLLLDIDIFSTNTRVKSIFETK